MFNWPSMDSVARGGTVGSTLFISRSDSPEVSCIIETVVGSVKSSSVVFTSALIVVWISYTGGCDVPGFTFLALLLLLLLLLPPPNRRFVIPFKRDDRLRSDRLSSSLFVDSVSSLCCDDGVDGAGDWRDVARFTNFFSRRFSGTLHDGFFSIIYVCISPTLSGPIGEPIEMPSRLFFYRMKEKVKFVSLWT